MRVKQAHARVAGRHVNRVARGRDAAALRAVERPRREDHQFVRRVGFKVQPARIDDDQVRLGADEHQIALRQNRDAAIGLLRQRQRRDRLIEAHTLREVLSVNGQVDHLQHAAAARTADHEGEIRRRLDRPILHRQTRGQRDVVALRIEITGRERKRDAVGFGGIVLHHDVHGTEQAVRRRRANRRAVEHLHARRGHRAEPDLHIVIDRKTGALDHNRRAAGGGTEIRLHARDAERIEIHIRAKQEIDQPVAVDHLDSDLTGVAAGRVERNRRSVGADNLTFHRDPAERHLCVRIEIPAQHHHRLAAVDRAVPLRQRFDFRRERRSDRRGEARLDRAE